MNSTLTFPSAQAARDFRHAHGTGGWIFSPDDGGEAILFPPHMPPVAIFRHPMTKGKSGALIGSA